MLLKCTDTDQIVSMFNDIEQGSTTHPVEEMTHRGVIKDTLTGETIVKTFGYTAEFIADDTFSTTAFAEWLGSQESLFQGWEIRYSMEGTLLRMFHYHDRWYVTTHKKLDAFKSRWSCRDTFGELFVKGLGEVFIDVDPTTLLSDFQASLDPEWVYVFLVRSNAENRIVCQTHFVKKGESLIYVGYFSKGEASVFHIHTLSTEHPWLCRLKGPQTVEVPINTIEAATEWVQTLNPYQYQGLLFLSCHGGHHRTAKLYHPKYIELAKLRDNNPNLRFRYLELRPYPDKLRALYMLYPKYAEVFDEYEEALGKIARMIYQYYVYRYIHNKYVTLPREEYLVIRKCHQWYMEDRENHRIFTQKVFEVLLQEPPLNLYKMIRRFTSLHTPPHRMRHPRPNLRRIQPQSPYPLRTEEQEFPPLPTSPSAPFTHRRLHSVWATSNPSITANRKRIHERRFNHPFASSSPHVLNSDNHTPIVDGAHHDLMYQCVKDIHDIEQHMNAVLAGQTDLSNHDGVIPVCAFD